MLRERSGSRREMGAMSEISLVVCLEWFVASVSEREGGDTARPTKEGGERNARVLFALLIDPPALDSLESRTR